MIQAIFSPCGQYRHILSKPHTNQCGIVLCNPSQAGRPDENGVTQSDATNNKITRFTADWGYGGYVIGNTADLIATNPKDMQAHPAPVSPQCDAYLLAIAALPLIVVGWGNDADPKRAQIVARILRTFGAQLYCFGINQNGSPKHPLYLPYSTKLMPWNN